MGVSCAGTLGGSRAHSTFFTSAAFAIADSASVGMAVGHPFTRVGINMAMSSFRTTIKSNIAIRRSGIIVSSTTASLGMLANTMDNSAAFACGVTSVPALGKAATRSALCISDSGSKVGRGCVCLSVDCVLIGSTAGKTDGTALGDLRCAFGAANSSVRLGRNLGDIPIRHG